MPLVHCYSLVECTRGNLHLALSGDSWSKEEKNKEDPKWPSNDVHCVDIRTSHMGG